MSTHKKRQPKGTPSGGQFATGSRNEIAGDLANHVEANGGYGWEFEEVLDSLRWEDEDVDAPRSTSASAEIMRETYSSGTWAMDAMIDELVGRLEVETGFDSSFLSYFDDESEDGQLVVTLHPDPSDRFTYCGTTIVLSDIFAAPEPGTSLREEMELKYEFLRERMAGALRFGQTIRKSIEN